MLVISNNLIGKMPLPEEAVIRLNLAWVKDIDEAISVLDGINGDVYLDYPDGRSKPPRPNISITEAIELSHRHNVKYFAVSNCEDIPKIKKMMDSVDVEFIPKIETKLGVKTMDKMVELDIKTFMLDKEDLYTNVRCNNNEYNKLVEEARKFNIIELQGVVFI